MKILMWYETNVKNPTYIKEINFWQPPSPGGFSGINSQIFEKENTKIKQVFGLVGF